MSVKVLIVDDSFFFRKRLSEAIDGKKGIEVVGFASNGREAIELVEKLRPDVVTLDVEMPEVNGLDALKTIMKKDPVPVLMFSSLTASGTKATISALEYGALDFLPKNFNDLADRKTDVLEIVTNKILALSRAQHLAMIKSVSHGIASSSKSVKFGSDAGLLSDSPSASGKYRADVSKHNDTVLRSRTTVTGTRNSVYGDTEKAHSVTGSVRDDGGTVVPRKPYSNDFKTLTKQITRNINDLSENISLRKKVSADRDLYDKETKNVVGDVGQRENRAVSDMKWRDVSSQVIDKDIRQQESFKKSQSDFHNFQRSFNEDGKTKGQAHVSSFTSKIAPSFSDAKKAVVSRGGSGESSGDEISSIIGGNDDQPFVSQRIFDDGNKSGENGSKSEEYSIVVIGASTGGPAALFEMIGKFPADFPVPILIVQHMPQNFTKAFAERLNKMSKIKVCEAHDNQELVAGCVFVAPGGMQTLVAKNNNGKHILMIKKSPSELYYRPCIDVTLGSVAKCYSNRVLSVVMTGMGADGTRGSGILRSVGASVWAQSEDSCVIYGMPKSVIEAGYADRIVELDDMSREIIEEVCGR